MTNKVPSDDIEQIVGSARLRVTHVGRAVSEEQTFYILHPHACLGKHEDLRECRYSKALDNGVGFEEEDVILKLFIEDESLVGKKFDMNFWQIADPENLQSKIWSED